MYDHGYRIENNNQLILGPENNICVDLLIYIIFISQEPSPIVYFIVY